MSFTTTAAGSDRATDRDRCDPITISPGRKVTFPRFAGRPTSPRDPVGIVKFTEASGMIGITPAKAIAPVPGSMTVLTFPKAPADTTGRPTTIRLGLGLDEAPGACWGGAISPKDSAGWGRTHRLRRDFAAISSDHKEVASSRGNRKPSYANSTLGVGRVGIRRDLLSLRGSRAIDHRDESTDE